MGFSDKQVGALRRGLNGAHVRTREAHGRELSYIEGWHAIAEANRIFGFEGWDRETVETRCVLNRELRGTYQAVYVAKVRITVHTDGQTIVREGHGSGESRGASPGETHDMALKVAETDGTKRALATFGKPFGLELYLSKKRASKALRKVFSSGTVEAGSIAVAPDQRTLSANGETGKLLETDSVSERTSLLAKLPSSVATADNFGLVPEATIPLAGSGRSALLSGTAKSTLAIGYPRRYRDKSHLGFVGSQPCLVCSRRPADAHHLRFAQVRAMSMKVSDEFTVPLCRIHHRQLHHSGNEMEWWNLIIPDVDPMEIAKGLWEQSRAILRDTGQSGFASAKS